MDENLQNFMRERGIDENVIEEFEKEKIDLTTLPLMEDEELKRYVPFYGDRLALKNYAAREGRTKRESLLDRIRNKYSMKRKSPDRIGGQERKKCGEKKEPRERMIDIGWQHRGKNDRKFIQVRTKQGGGSRSVKVMDNITKQNILEIARSMFFPDGNSKFGHSSKFAFDLWDFKCNVITNDLTIRQMYELTGLNRLRFYLSTTEKNLPETIVSEPSQSDVDKGKQIITDPLFLEPLPSENEPLLLFADDGGPPLGTLQNYINIYSVEESQANSDNELVFLSSEQEPIRVTLHREFVFKEMIDIFKNIPIEVPIEIEMVLASGKKEIGLDLGGVYRDCLSEFWETFYLKVTWGDEYKVPYLRHDFKDNDWTAIAKILLKGYKDIKYFPIKIAPAFIKQCLGITDQEEILNSFSKYMNARDWGVIQKAFNEFSSVDVSELIDILEPMDCKWLITENNFKQLIEDIAYKEIIQKPKFVIDIWRNVLDNFLNIPQVCEIYDIRTPIPKNILPLLDFSEENSICLFLKRFIRESKDELLQNLVRFCTGANMLTENKIKIEFNSSTDHHRNPVGHTCSCTLELSRNYNNYVEFRNEMTDILKSNIWVMDMV